MSGGRDISVESGILPDVEPRPLAQRKELCWLCDGSGEGAFGTGRQDAALYVRRDA